MWALESLVEQIPSFLIVPIPYLNPPFLNYYTHKFIMEQFYL